MNSKNKTFLGLTKEDWVAGGNSTGDIICWVACASLAAFVIYALYDLDALALIAGIAFVISIMTYIMGIVAKNRRLNNGLKK